MARQLSLTEVSRNIVKTTYTIVSLRTERILAPESFHHYNYYFYIGWRSSSMIMCFCLDFKRKRTNKIVKPSTT